MYQEGEAISLQILAVSGFISHKNTYSDSIGPIELFVFWCLFSRFSKDIIRANQS